MSGELSRLTAPKGANRRGKHKARGSASGDGKTAGRGMKGQKARKSGGVRPGFEGGQMPLARRLPKRGFKNIFSKDFAEVRLGDLTRFEAGSVVDQAALRSVGLGKGGADGVKILATGTIDRALTVKVNRITKGARAQIEAAGGTVELIADKAKWERQDTRAKRRAAAKTS